MNDNQVYMDSLIRSSQQKLELFESLLQQTKEQERVLYEDKFNPDEFDELLSKKEQLLVKVAELDEGFDMIYQRIQSQLTLYKEQWKPEIMKLQSLISSITKIAVDLKALEQRNKTRMTMVLQNERLRVRNYKVGSKVAAGYYKNMSNQHMGQSYFLDQKN